MSNEELVTTKTEKRIALSNNNRIIAVINGGLTATSQKELRKDRPDVVLLLGRTDDKNSAVLLKAAETLAKYK